MRYRMPLFAILSLVGAFYSPALAQQGSFLERLSPDYVERQRMTKICAAYGVGSQPHAQCLLQVEQILAQGRAAPNRAPVQCTWVGQFWTCQ